MKTPRIIAVSLAVVGLLSSVTLVAQAQTYVYPIGGTSYGSTSYTAPYTAPYNNGCSVITNYLQVGSTDAYTSGQVTTLQLFLDRMGYLGGTSGIFDANTYTGVVRFQLAHGITPTGTVGPITRAAIQQAGCTGTGVYVPPTTIVNPIYPIYPGSPSNCYYTTNSYSYNNSYPYNNCGVVLNSASASYNYNNMSLTLVGSGFTIGNNTVHFDGSTYTGYSSNGTTLTVTFNGASYYSGNYTIYVVNGNGMTSNSLTFPITSNGSNGTGSAYLSSINGPTNVQSGSSNTWNVTFSNNGYNNYYGSQNATVNVTWGDGTSNNSQQVYVSGSQNLTFNHTYYSTGTYTMQVSANVNGQTTYQTLTVTVNGGGSSYGTPSISYLSPSSGYTGTGITIYGSGFSSYGNTVHFGNGGTMNVSSNNGSSIYYTIPSRLTGCDLTQTSGYCAQWITNVTSGSYPIYVTNNSGQSSNTMYFQVR